MPHSRSISDLRLVLDLKGLGHSDREVSESTGVPISTIRKWRNGGLPKYAQPSSRQTLETCPACGDEAHAVGSTSSAYPYLLGVYLGDGYLARNGSSWTLRITLDTAYPGVIAECVAATEEVSGGRRVTARPHHSDACIEVSCTWRRWLCLFPQHGSGRKHQRRIKLAPWQQALVDAEPGRFLRGLIHTDGWRGVNRVHVKGNDYAYPRYQFSNRSDDIRKLFTDACDRIDVKWRPWTRYHISVAQREAVARLDAFVGPKT